MQTQSSADRITTSLSLAHQRKNKQTNKQELSTNLTLYKLPQITGPTSGGKKPKRRMNSTLNPGKRRPHTQYIKRIIIMKRQRNTTFIWISVFLVCSFICVVFLCLFIIFFKLIVIEVSFSQASRLNSFFLLVSALSGWSSGLCELFIGLDLY